MAGNEPFDFMSDAEERQGSVPTVELEGGSEEKPEKEIKWEDANVDSFDDLYAEEPKTEKELREEDAKKEPEVEGEGAADVPEIQTPEVEGKEPVLPTLEGAEEKKPEGEEGEENPESKKEEVKDSAEILALKKQIESLVQASDAQKQREANAQAEVEAKARKEQVADKVKEGDKIPEYAFDVPDELMKGMSSEDAGERKVAVGQLIQGTAQAIHKTVVAEMKTAMANSFNQMPKMMSQMMEMRSMQQKIHQDFYGKFPDLNKPELVSIVQQVGKQVAEKYNSEHFTPEMRDEIGFQVRAIIGSVGLKTPPTAPVQPAATTVPKAPVIAGSGAARAGGKSMSEDAAFINMFYD